jgi:basic amino acid/polyamine antiporter, APA family
VLGDAYAAYGSSTRPITDEAVEREMRAMGAGRRSRSLRIAASKDAGCSRCQVLLHVDLGPLGAIALSDDGCAVSAKTQLNPGVDVTRAAPPPPSTGSATEAASHAAEEHRFGLPTATALVIGSVIGTGVFALPSALAAYGPISLVAFVLVTIGALAVALTFGALSRRIPGSGGPYVYARDAFGSFAGFLNAWSYWITAWAGNAAIAVAWVGYVEVFWNKGHSTRWSIVIALAGLWIPAVVNLSGLRNTGALQVVTTVLKFVPLLFMATVGLFFIDAGNFGSFNVSGLSAGAAISAAAAIALFSYLGIETASVAAGRVRNPRRNVGRATVLGTLGCAVVYILGTVAVFGTVPNAALQTSTAPFTDSANAMFGGSWAGQAVAVAAVVSGLGALIGWTLIVAEMSMAAARDGLFPAQFNRTRRGVPAFGIVIDAAGLGADRGQLHQLLQRLHHHRPAQRADRRHPVPVQRRSPAVLAAHPGPRSPLAAPCP